MRPSDKSPQVEKTLTNIFGFDRRKCIENNVCVPAPIGCGKEATSFDSNIERREYQISGLCSSCQKQILG